MDRYTWAIFFRDHWQPSPLIKLKEKLFVSDFKYIQVCVLSLQKFAMNGIAENDSMFLYELNNFFIKLYSFKKRNGEI